MWIWSGYNPMLLLSSSRFAWILSLPSVSLNSDFSSSSLCFSEFHLMSILFLSVNKNLSKYAKNSALVKVLIISISFYCLSKTNLCWDISPLFSRANSSLWFLSFSSRLVRTELRDLSNSSSVIVLTFSLIFSRNVSMLFLRYVQPYLSDWTKTKKPRISRDSLALDATT